MATNKLNYYKTSNFKKRYHLFLRFIAKYWLKLNRQVKVIAIVGSYGKTTTSQAIYSLLSKKAPTLTTDINLDTIYNIPLTMLKLRKKHRYLILEVGVDHKNEMDFHLELFKPHIVVFTGITPVHSDSNLLGSIEGIIKEKSKIIKALDKNGWLIANGNDKNVIQVAKTYWQNKTLLYSSENKNADIYAKNINLSLSGTEFNLKTKSGSVQLKGSFVGKQFVEAISAAAGVAIIENIQIENLQKVAKFTKPLKGRMSIEKGPNNSILINDSLRANPVSTKAGLETLSAIKGKRKIAILGEMGELGKYKKIEHKKIGQLVGNLSIDHFIGVGPMMKIAANQVKNKKVITYPAKDVFKAAEILKTKVKITKNDLVYLKGSLLKHMERVLIIAEGEKIGCQVISCPFYNPCTECKYIKSGYHHS